MSPSITDILLRWYDSHKRALPWRNTRDPYHIWVSEIILQQTRVAQGTAYYYRFTKKFPDVYALAKTPLEQVLKVWEGLGYYSRARNMHETAKKIIKDHGGRFPQRYEDLLKLKGIGPYTAAAIVSMAYQQPFPVVDGNVFRVFSRLFAIDIPSDTSSGKKKVTRLADSLMSTERPGDFNQAVMEFGALQCVPGEPDCSTCPLKERCLAKKQNSIGDFPVKGKLPRVTTRYLHYLVWIYKGNIMLRQRKEKDIWHKLYDFPEIQAGNEDDPEKLLVHLLQREGFSAEMKKHIFISEQVFHQLTHQRIIARFYHVTEYVWPEQYREEYLIVPVAEMATYAFPRLITAYLEKYPERFNPPLRNIMADGRATPG